MIEFKERDGDYFKRKDICLRDDSNPMHGLNILYGDNGDFYFNTWGNEQDLNNSTFICQSDFTIPNGNDCYTLFLDLINSVKQDQGKSQEPIVDEEGRISIFSDDASKENANKLTIEKGVDGIRLSFFQNPNDSAFNIGIRISNSGSRYDPLNMHFMDLYNKFQQMAKTKEDTGR